MANKETNDKNALPQVVITQQAPQQLNNVGGGQYKTINKDIDTLEAMAQLGFDIVKIFDPTGISSYGDVYEAGKRFYEDPSLKNAGLTLWEIVGALPMIGKFAKIPNRFVKISRRMPEIALNGAKRVESINRKIDTVPEWIPYLRPATSKIQDYTSNLLFP